MLERLYTAQKARGTDQLEVVLVSRCREAKATKDYSLTMPWVLIWHNANNKAGMKAHMTALMEKFNVSTIPALVLLVKGGCVICPEARGWVNADQKRTAFPWREKAEAPMPGPGARAAETFDLPPTKRPNLLVPTAQWQHANQTHSKFPGRKQNPVSAVHSTGWCNGRGERLANGPSPPARPMARVNFDLPPAKQPNQSFSPEKILPPSQAPNNFFAARATATPEMAPPQSFLSHRARTMQDRGAAEQPDVHARAWNWVAQQKPDPPNIVAAKLPPDKPNLRFAPETIPQGKLTLLMQPQHLAAVHSFAPTILKWQQGIPIDCSSDWDRSVIVAAVERGPHPTARTPKSIALFAEDIEYQIKAGFCWVFPWEELKHCLPANCKISPVAVVPQVGRRGQIILNLLFPVYQSINGVVTVTQESVNDSTVLNAPSEAVKEIGKVFPRLLQYMRDTPEGLHILFSKLDISDWFWRLVVQEADSYNFGYVLPQHDGEPIQIVVPSVVQMGWVESPPLFCAVTESARDITQHLIDNKVCLPTHPLEDKISIEKVPMRARMATPTKLLQVYVDNFCNAAMQLLDKSHILMIRWASIYAVHAVFPEPAVTGHQNRKDPLSNKKLEQGDGNFASTKDMIGFTFNGIKRTIQLPPQKAMAYICDTHRILR
jgi:hypothetical protein